MPLPLRVRQPPHCRRDVRLPVLDNNGRVKVDVQNFTFTEAIF